MFRATRAFKKLFLVVLFAVALACGKPKVQAPDNAISPVVIDAVLGNKFVKANASQPMLAKIALSTQRRTTNVRPPVNVALLVDTSGSMEGRAIEDARAASLALLESLSKDDRLAVIVFHSKAEVLLPSTRIDDADIKDLKRKIQAMKAQGTTDMGHGLQMALDEVQKNFSADGVNRIVMLGDGVPNEERLVHGPLAQARSRGISITTLGLGNDYDEMLMGRIAQESGGKFSYVEDSNKVASFFKEEVVRLHKVVAKNAVLEIQPGPGVVVQNVIGRPLHRVDRGVQVMLGDLSLGESHELVVELASNPAKDGSTVEAFDAVLRWQDGSGGAMHEDRVFVGAKATSDEARISAGKDEKVAEAFARAKDAAATLQKIEMQRNMMNKKSGMNNNVNAPSPTTAQTSFEDNLAAPEEGEKTTPGSSAALAKPAPPRMSPTEMRRAHQDAIQNFQAK